LKTQGAHRICRGPERPWKGPPFPAPGPRKPIVFEARGIIRTGGEVAGGLSFSTAPPCLDMFSLEFMSKIGPPFRPAGGGRAPRMGTPAADRGGGPGSRASGPWDTGEIGPEKIRHWVGQGAGGNNLPGETPAKLRGPSLASIEEGPNLPGGDGPAHRNGANCGGPPAASFGRWIPV